MKLLKRKPRTDTDSTYIPHGINEDFFYPITDKKEMIRNEKIQTRISW